MRVKGVRGPVTKAGNVLSHVSKTIGAALGTIAMKTGTVYKSASPRPRRRVCRVRPRKTKR